MSRSMIKQLVRFSPYWLPVAMALVLSGVYLWTVRDHVNWEFSLTVPTMRQPERMEPASVEQSKLVGANGAAAAPVAESRGVLSTVCYLDPPEPAWVRAVNVMEVTLGAAVGFVAGFSLFTVILGWCWWSFCQAQRKGR